MEEMFSRQPPPCTLVDPAGYHPVGDPVRAEQLAYTADEWAGHCILDVGYEADREAVQPHTIERILRDEPVHRKTLRELAQIVAYSRSVFVRQHRSRLANLCLLPTPARSRYDCVPVSDCCRLAVPRGPLALIGHCLAHRSWVFGVLLCATDFFCSGERSAPWRGHRCFFDDLSSYRSLDVQSPHPNGAARFD